jgi:hypothetical protein
VDDLENKLLEMKREDKKILEAEKKALT